MCVIQLLCKVRFVTSHKWEAKMFVSFAVLALHLSTLMFTIQRVSFGLKHLERCQLQSLTKSVS